MNNETKTHNHTRIKPDNEVESMRPSLDQLYEKDVVTLKTTDSLFDAAKTMLDKHVGNVVIVDAKNGKNVPVGILTDRDIVINSIAKKLNPETVKISDIMTKKVVTASEEDDFTDLVKYITEEGVGRLPIVDASGSLKGILSAKRLIQYFAQGLCELTSAVQQERREDRTH